MKTLLNTTLIAASLALLTGCDEVQVVRGFMNRYSGYPAYSAVGYRDNADCCYGTTSTTYVIEETWEEEYWVEDVWYEDYVVTDTWYDDYYDNSAYYWP
ncbi:MAG: hypothetical protein KKB50_11480 [Planctomycetes bacterium]|nr:hypothetical protein [Planctomycetota bacterium]